MPLPAAKRIEGWIVLASNNEAVASLLAIIDPWTGGIWFTIGLLIVLAVFGGAWLVLRGRQRWLLLLPALVALVVLAVAFDSMVVAPWRWERDGVCSGWWQAVPSSLPDGSYNRRPELCIAPM